MLARMEAIDPRGQQRVRFLQDKKMLLDESWIYKCFFNGKNY